MPRSFEQWFSEQRAPEEPELPRGVREILSAQPDGSCKVLARCCSCENDYQLDLDRLSDFDPDVNYCGGSPHCLP